MTLWEGHDAHYWRAAWQAGEVRLLESVGSTNDVIAELAAAGAPDFSIAVAETQTQGRGRGGTTWKAQPGTSLLFSLLLRLKGDAPAPGCAPVRIGLVVAEAIGDAHVKWPNDVVIPGHGKVAGILCEGVFGSHIIAGIGINVNQSREAFGRELDGRACSVFSATGRRIDRALLLTTVLAGIKAVASRINEPFDDAELPRLAARDVLAGRDVVVETASDALTGIARGVAPDGALLIDSAKQIVRVYNGSVRLADAKTYPGGAETP